MCAGERRRRLQESLRGVLSLQAVGRQAGGAAPVQSEVTPMSCTMLGWGPMAAMMLASMRIASSTSLRGGGVDGAGASWDMG
jgi:hypothetical protein